MLAALEPCELLADVGTDHGYVPIAAVTRGLAAAAIAADLRAAPLSVARRHVERAGVQDRVRLVQSDGLRGLVHLPIDAVVLAGMSGTLIARLCGATPMPSLRQLVAQANTGARDLRAWAHESGWHLQGEQLVEEGGRFFTVCAFGRADRGAYAVPGWTLADLFHVGPLLLARRDPAALRYYQMQCARVADLPRAAEHAMWSAACAGVSSTA